MANIRDYMTVVAAAEYLGVSKDTLRRWDRAGKLRAHRHPVNRYRLYARPDLDAFLRTIGANDGVPAGPPPRRPRFRDRKDAVASMLKNARAMMRSQETADRPA